MNIFKIAAFAMIATSMAASSMAEANVYQLLDGPNIYRRVRNDTRGGPNEEVFLEYEKQESKRIIAACISSSSTYSVVAQWNLKISSKDEAQQTATILCHNSGAFSSVLLGYKIKRDIRF